MEYEASGQASFNECRHYSYNVIPLGRKEYSGFTTGTLFDEAMSVSDMPLLVTRQLYERSFQGVDAFERDWQSAIATVDFQPAFEHAYHALQKRVYIQRKISILNFIHELKEFKKMFEYWDKQRKLLYNIANGKLNVKYGWLPFLSDCVSILKGLANFREKLKFLLENQGTIRRFRGSVDFFGLPTIARGASENGGEGTICDSILFDPRRPIPISTRSEFSKGLRCNYTVKYSYVVKPLSPLQAQVRTFCDSFGIVWDPQILWDALPFTFIVDWFWRVGDFLHDLEGRQAMPIHLRIHDACFSVKAQQMLTASVPLRNGDVNVLTTPISYYGVRFEGKQYLRFRHIPSKDDLRYAGWTRAQLEKLITGTALFVTNTPRFRAKKEYLTPRKTWLSLLALRKGRAVAVLD
jgi:hypothetical protein